MKRRILISLLFLFLVPGFSEICMAEPPEFERPPTKEQMENVRKRIETLRIWKLTKTLDLDEKTSAQLFPLINKYDKKRTEAEIVMKEGMKDLREALKDRRESALKNILDKLEQSHKEMQRINDEERAEMKKVLTLEQQAKFIISQQEFERDIRKIIEEVKERRPERFEKNRPERPSRPERERPDRQLPPER